MPGLRGSNRVPGLSARERRNANANAMAYDSRSMGDGLSLSATRLLQLALLATGGLEFSSGNLKIKYPADGGVKTSSVGLEVDISGMAAQATPAEGDLFVLEDTGGTDAKEKATLAELRDVIIDPPADGAIKNTTKVFEVDISGMAAKAVPVDADLFLLEDTVAGDAKKKITVAEMRTMVGNPQEYITKSGAYTTTAADRFIICTGTWTLTLIAAASAAGTLHVIKNAGTGKITLDPDGAETIDGEANRLLKKLESLSIFCDGTEWHII